MTKESRRTRDKAARAEHIASLLHQKIAHERSQPATAEREARLRGLMGLPATPEIDRERDDE
jgi:hypothetical protein